MSWCVEMCYGVGFTIYNIEADTRHDAIEKAKEKVKKETSILEHGYNNSGLIFEEVTYINETIDF